MSRGSKGKQKGGKARHKKILTIGSAKSRKCVTVNGSFGVATSSKWWRACERSSLVAFAVAILNPSYT